MPTWETAIAEHIVSVTCQARYAHYNIGCSESVYFQMLSHSPSCFFVSTP